MNEIVKSTQNRPFRQFIANPIPVRAGLLIPEDETNIQKYTRAVIQCYQNGWQLRDALHQQNYKVVLNDNVQLWSKSFVGKKIEDLEVCSQIVTDIITAHGELTINEFEYMKILLAEGALGDSTVYGDLSSQFITQKILRYKELRSERMSYARKLSERNKREQEVRWTEGKQTQLERNIKTNIINPKVRASILNEEDGLFFHDFGKYDTVYYPISLAEPIPLTNELKEKAMQYAQRKLKSYTVYKNSKSSKRISAYEAISSEESNNGKEYNMKKLRKLYYLKQVYATFSDEELIEMIPKMAAGFSRNV